MRRKIIVGLIATIALIALLSAGFCAWVFGTTGGARWALGELSSRTALAIGEGKVEGSLWGGLGLEKVTVRWQSGSFRAGQIYLRWRPLDLIYGRVAIGSLDLRGIDIHDERQEEKKPPDFGWPKVSGLPARLSAHIENFAVHGLTYRRLKKSPLRVENLSAKITWKRSTLSVENLLAGSREGRISGTASAGFAVPSLVLDLAAIPTRPVAKINRLLLDAKLKAAAVSGPPKGNIRLTGSTGQARRIELTGGVEVARHSIILTDIRVAGVVRTGAVQGNGEVTFPGGNPLLRLATRLRDLDLSPVVGRKTDISGSLTVEGTTERYSGRFDLSSRADAIKTVRIAGLLSGGSGGLALTGLDGSWLAGTIRGGARIGWGKTFSLSGALQARDLDPSLISKQWKGRINADLQGKVLLSKGKPPEAEFDAQLLQSTMRGKALTGRLKAKLINGDLLIDSLLLHGKGFDIAARGELSRRLGFRADVTDLSGLVPETKGKVRAEGWVRRYRERFSGEITGNARGIAAGGVQAGAADFSGSLSGAGGYPVRVNANVRGLIFRGFRADSLNLGVQGTAESHSINLSMRSGKANVHARLAGGYGKGIWQGKILGLSGADGSGPWGLAGPVDLAFSRERFSLSSMVLTGAKGEMLEAEGGLAFHPLQGVLQAEWQKVSLARLTYWISDLRITGATSGKVSSRWRPNSPPRISGEAAASGTAVLGGKTITVHHLSAALEWSSSGLAASLDAGFDKGAFVKGRFSSSTSAGMTIPEEGRIDAKLQDLDISFFSRWFPAGLDLKGRISGDLKGRLLAGRRLDISGSASLAGGAISRRAGHGQMTASLRTAATDFRWQDRAITGNISLVLEEYGRAAGSFTLPLPARLPISIDKKGPVRASINGRLSESGMLTALFPGMVRETHGQIDFGINLTGTWKSPDIGGTMRLSNAGAYLPAGGIRVKDVALTARLEGEGIVVDSFHASSGKGGIQGNAEIVLKGWNMKSYRGTVKGREFQLIYLPELRVDGSPDLAFEGTPGKLAVTGQITIPYMLVLQSRAKTPVGPSRDVIIVDTEKKEERQLKTALDIRVKVVFGKDVNVKAEGVDAQLAGEVNVVAMGVNDIRGKGEIHVVKGKFSAYGVDLDIRRGKVVFTGRKINRPDLDILAIKKIEQVQAGVLVTGRPPNPIVKLYSNPAMSDTDTLAYIVLGHPLGSSNEQALLVARAAGFLFSSSQASTFQHELKQRLGLDTLDVETGTVGGVSRSLVTVGKYLAPNLYISYGRSIFSGSNLFRVRYDLSKHWQVESESGTESGADIFYKIDFK